MQEPSPGNSELVVTHHDMSMFREAGTSSHIVNQCNDISNTALGNVPPVLTSSPGEAGVMDPQAQAQFEADKRAVYKHPLFPLLALLFEKCEMATQSAEIPSSESFNMDIQAFVQHQERDCKPFFSDDPEVDGLMVKAIQVLRIHLLELEKVQELCKDFCNRYITCLKNKMQSENLLRSDYPALGSSTGASSPEGSSPASTPPQQQVVASNGSVGNVVLQQQNAVPMQTLNSGQIVSGGTVYQMVQTPQGLVAQPIQIQTTQQIQPVVTTAHVIHGSTPLSQIGAAPAPLPSQDSRIQPILAPRTPSSQSGEDDDEILGKKKQKRGVLPKHATSIMRSWLFQHIVHPYPTEDEKRQIAAQTNLTLLQVNNWFINARRRILQPMLDASNPDASHKAKKAKTQSNRQVQRFWPENIASIQPQLPPNCQSQQSMSDQNAEASQSQSSYPGPLSDLCNQESSNAASSPSGTLHSSANSTTSQNESDTGAIDDQAPCRSGYKEEPSNQSGSEDNAHSRK